MGLEQVVVLPCSSWRENLTKQQNRACYDSSKGLISLSTPWPTWVGGEHLNGPLGQQARNQALRDLMS